MTQSTTDLIKRVRELTKAATPGPWHVGHVDENLDKVEIESPDGIVVASEVHRNNEALICESRVLLPLLADALDKATQDVSDLYIKTLEPEERIDMFREENKRLKDALQWYADGKHVHFTKGAYEAWNPETDHYASRLIIDEVETGLRARQALVDERVHVKEKG